MTRVSVEEKAANAENKIDPINSLARNQLIKRTPNTELSQRIINATIEEVATKGVLGARIGEITRSADTSDPAFYRYFPGIKQAVLFIMSEYYWKPLNQRVSHYHQVSSDPKQLFFAVVQALIQSTDDDPNYLWLKQAQVFRIVISQMRNPVMLPESMLDAEYNGFLNKLTEIITSGQKQQLFNSKLRPELLSHLVVTTMHGLLMQNIPAIPTIKSSEEEIRQIATQLIGTS